MPTRGVDLPDFVKLFSTNTISRKPPESVVIFAPGSFFFVRRFDLPAGMASGEIESFVDLQLEELSPFLLEQLYHGYVMAEDGSAVLVYAAYRRRFEAVEVEAWSPALFVMPDFVPVLHLEYAQPTIVLFRSETSLSALRFDGQRPLPDKLVSRPLSREAGEEEARGARERLLGALEAGGESIEEFQLAGIPEQRSHGLTFEFQPRSGEEHGREIVVPIAACWNMDVRERGFVAQRRRRLGFDLILWRVVLGTAAVVALLLVGEILLLAGKGYVAWLAGKTTRQAPTVASLEDKHTVASRLADFRESGLSPFSMLSAVSGPKPPSVYFTRATAEGRNRLTVDAISQSVADMNAFEAGLRGLPDVEKVELLNHGSREEGTTFSVIVTFRSGTFAQVPAAGVQVARSGGGA